MNRIFRTLVLLLNLLIFNGLNAQEAAHFAGDLLVSLHPNLTPEHLVDALIELDRQPTGLAVVQKVADPMNIWLLHFDSKNVDENRMLEAVRRHPDVAIAQFNHVVEYRSPFDAKGFFETPEFLKMQNPKFGMRNSPSPTPDSQPPVATLPDDPNFNSQWQYINTGASGGTVDADLDIEEAWDITTGGLTALGDTIVVCVVDGGVNINHPDFGDNLWKNWAEIPDNNIDDDQNGYTDDFLGWSTYNNSDQITNNNGHGTPVCGIVGAQGNNGVGVSGVNWNVKIMFIQGGGGEANVLASYSYPYKFRKLYNETNGAEGAFVVSTNSSWGTDFGQPANAPLWCAFYDTLGKVGILSCGATINGNQDVDVVGDLPTACPSDWLISVTNCGRSGKKETVAGYGLTTIDLGSFGANAYTLTSSGYGGFGGTSGATPHVAGGIGLLYSAPCAGFMSVVKSDPELAATFMKNYLLAGVDPEATLDGKTVSGGRLNLFNSINLLLAGCGTCQPPLSPLASAISDTSTTISFKKLDTSTVANLRIREVGATNWATMSNIQSPFIFTDLLACSNYEFQLETECTDTTSGWTASKFFKTDGCCEVADNLIVNGISDSTALLNWKAVTAAINYEIELTTGGQTAILNAPAGSNSLVINDLEDCTDYQIVVKTICNGMPTAISNPVFFKTKGCGACLDNTYCATTGGNPNEEWIAGVQLADLDHTAPAPTTGYEGNLPAAANLEQFHAYPITLTPGFSAGAQNEYFRAWIDFNQNGVFEEPSERVFDSGTAKSVPQTGLISVGNVPLGPTRMRVSMKYIGANGQKPTACAAFFNYGQVKDFCVNVLPGTPECIAPQIEQAAKTDSTATLIWTAVPFATQAYDVRYIDAGMTQNWTLVSTPLTSITLDKLEKCTDYLAQIRATCDPIAGDWGPETLFSTDCSSQADEPDFLQKMSVRPNPFNAGFEVVFEMKNAAEMVVEIVSPTGQIVENQWFASFGAGENRMTFSTEKWPTGIYFLKMKTEDGLVVRRVLKQ